MTSGDTVPQSLKLGSKTLTLSGGTSATSSSVVMADGGLSGGTGGNLLVSGGTHTLTGTNTYTGATTISGGTLALTGTGSIATSSGLTQSGTGVFDISGTTSGATIQSLASTSTSAGVSLGAKTLTLSNASGSYAGVIGDGGLSSGTGGSLILSGGTETLTGTNTYTGATTVSAGTLQVGDGTTGSISSSSAVSLASGATLALNRATGSTFSNAVTDNGTVNFIQSGTLTASGVISGTGTLTQSGTGTTTLSGTNTYTGGTTVNVGRIKLGNTSALGTGLSLIGDNTGTGSLDLSGFSISNALQLRLGTLLNSNASTAATVSGNVNLSGNGSGGSFGSADGGSITLSGVLSNIGSFGLAGENSAVTLTNAGNTFTGATTLWAHTTLILKDGGSIANSSGVTMYGSYTAGAAVTTLDISGTTSGATIKSLTSPNTNPLSLKLGSKTLTLSGGTSATSFSGVMADGGISGGTGGQLAVFGGTHTLTGTNTYTGATTLSAGTLVISNNTPSTASSLFSGPGGLVIQPTSNSFTSGFSTSGWNFDSVTRLGSLTIGKSGNTADITVANATTVAGPVSLFGGNIAINGALTATSDTITLTSSGNVTQTAALTASNLLLSGGSVSLTNTSNAIGTLAATGVSGLSYEDSNSLTVGAVGSTNGISATGAVTVSTVSGNLTVASAISTSSTSTSALTLNAGSSTSAGTSTGGDLIFSGTGSASVGTGGSAKLYTGSVSGSTGLAALVGGSGSGRFRYGSDESASNYTLALGTGLNAIYREQPTITRSVDSKTMTYGDALPTYTFTASGGSNGDTSTNIFGASTAPSVAVGGSTSTSGNYTAGTHTLLGTGGATISPLGYAITNSSTAGTLTVNTKAITISGITPNSSTLTPESESKIYDGLRTYNYSTTRLQQTDCQALLNPTDWASRSVGGCR